MQPNNRPQVVAPGHRGYRVRLARINMQESAEKRQRQEDAARYLDRNIHHLDDAPRWDIER